MNDKTQSDARLQDVMENILRDIQEWDTRPGAGVSYPSW